jgi:hypothetical protein
MAFIGNRTPLASNARPGRLLLLLAFHAGMKNISLVSQMDIFMPHC